MTDDNHVVGQSYAFASEKFLWQESHAWWVPGLIGQVSWTVMVSGNYIAEA